MTVSDLLEQPCTSLIISKGSYRVLIACFKLVTTTGNKQCEHMLTACEQICNNLFADL
jgi:hypothetical protein